jgi:hypothetical protein
LLDAFASAGGVVTLEVFEMRMLLLWFCVLVSLIFTSPVVSRVVLLILKPAYSLPERVL